jgi:hypothetical protein
LWVWFTSIVFQILAYYQQSYFWVETKGKTLEEIDAIFDTRTRRSLSTVEATGEIAAAVNAGTTEMLPRERVK